MAFNESMQKLVETFFDLLDEQGKYPDPSKPLENQFNYIVNELISMIKQPTTYQVIITGLEDVLAEHEKDEDRVTGVKAFLYTIGTGCSRGYSGVSVFEASEARLFSFGERGVSSSQIALTSSR